MPKLYLSLTSALLLTVTPAWAQEFRPGDEIVTVPLRIDEIIVEGFYDGGAIARTLPASIDLIGRDRLEIISAIHPAETLNTVAGVNIHRGSGQEHLTAIRSQRPRPRHLWFQCCARPH